MSELLKLSQPNHAKLRIALMWRLQGAKMYKALAALELGESYSKGNTRKDGITPEYAHQIRIALHAFTLKGVSDYDLELLICVILLHDIMEDYNVERLIIMNVIDAAAKRADPKYDGNDGVIVACSVWAMTKTYKGVKKSPERVFDDIANDMYASLAKGLDRINNFQSMVGVFKLAKRIEYIQEGLKFFLPMLKMARKYFPHHLDAYLNIETVLKYQIELIQVINDTDYVESINSAQN